MDQVTRADLERPQHWILVLVSAMLACSLGSLLNFYCGPGDNRRAWLAYISALFLASEVFICHLVGTAKTEMKVGATRGACHLCTPKAS